MIDRCYVYKITVNGVDRYIGKGTGRRSSEHLRIAARINVERCEGKIIKALKFHNRLAKALCDGSRIEIVKIATGLSSQAAFDLEVSEIAASKIGQLWNETKGGDGLDSATAKRLWADPDFRIKMINAGSTKEARRKKSEAAKRQMSADGARQELSSKIKSLWSDPKYVEKSVTALRKPFSNPNVRNRLKEAAIRRYSDPNERTKSGDRLRRIVNSEKFKKQQSHKMKELWSNPIFRKKCTSQWTDPEKQKKRAANLTPEFLAKRGRLIAEGLARRKALTGSIR